jgi:hypothetical protein
LFSPWLAIGRAPSITAGTASLFKHQKSPLSALHSLLQSFWSRLAGKYGNKFFWQEKGEAASIMSAVSTATRLLGLC